jgi:hypothetical protein
VRGLARLRVADASVMPLLVGANTNAAAVMIGEKASDLIWRRSTAHDPFRRDDFQPCPRAHRGLSGHFINGAWVRGEGAIRAGPGDRNPSAPSRRRRARGGRGGTPPAPPANPEWSAMPAAQRERLLLRLADIVEAESDEIAAIETLDNGMPYAIARMMAVGSRDQRDPLSRRLAAPPDGRACRCRSPATGTAIPRMIRWAWPR